LKKDKVGVGEDVGELSIDNDGVGDTEIVDADIVTTTCC